MNLIPTLGRIPTKAFNPETNDLETRIVAAGGTLSASSKDYVEKFVRDCKNHLIWDKLIDVGLFVGDQLAAALVKLKRPGGGQSSLTNINFVAGDYSERGSSGGLLGNGASKILRTGTAQSTIGATAHLSFYLREDLSTNYLGFVGAINGTDNFILSQTTEIACRYGGAEQALSGQTSKGFWCGVRESNNVMKIYKNGVMAGSNSTTVSVPSVSEDFAVFGLNNGGVNGNQLDKRGSFYSIGLPLNATETMHLYNAVQTLQRNLGREV